MRVKDEEGVASSAFGFQSRRPSFVTLRMIENFLPRRRRFVWKQKICWRCENSSKQTEKLTLRKIRVDAFFSDRNSRRRGRRRFSVRLHQQQWNRRIRMISKPVASRRNGIICNLRKNLRITANSKSDRSRSTYQKTVCSLDSKTKPIPIISAPRSPDQIRRRLKAKR